MPPDAAGAIAWYRRAAEQGHARAQYNLGGMYAEGRGVPPDAVEAHMWLTIAASRSTGAEREQIVTARAAVAVRRRGTRRTRGMRNRAAPPSDTGREGLILSLSSSCSPRDGRTRAGFLLLPTSARGGDG